VLETFEKGRALSSHNIERVLVPYENGANLPAYFIPATHGDTPGPAAIFLCGLDTTKEISSLRVRDHLAARGIACLAVDTPGIGEALRLGKLPTRYDYEVPVAAAIDYLQSRPDVDPTRIGIIGSSLGGYYVARAAAFEPCLRAAVAWGVIYDYHAVWQRRLTVGGAVATAGFQLMFVTGTESTEAAMARIENFMVQPIGGHIQCPFLIVHGAEDQQVPPGDAEKMFDAIGSTDKSLMICDGRNAGAAHCQFDNHLPAMLSVADWMHMKLAAPVGP
jgi:dienelactone hydrolase